MRTLIIAALILFVSCEAFKVGDKACIQSGLNLRNGPCGSVIATSSGSLDGKVLAIEKKTCSFGTYTWIQVQTAKHGKVWAAKETNLIHVCNPGVSKDHNVPQVHQVWDTPDGFAGYWACGPTSAVMAAAYFKKIPPKPITIHKSTTHTNDFGYYVSNTYTAPDGTVLNRAQKDSAGKLAHGAYGTCTDGGMTWAWRIQEYFKHHRLGNKFYDTATKAIIVRAINAGHLVVLSTKLTSSGHLILIRGYENGGNVLIANDPYGKANGPGYGRHMDGRAVRYSWEYVKAKWMVEVWA